MSLCLHKHEAGQLVPVTAITLPGLDDNRAEPENNESSKILGLPPSSKQKQILQEGNQGNRPRPLLCPLDPEARHWNMTAPFKGKAHTAGAGDTGRPSRASPAGKEPREAGTPGPRSLGSRRRPGRVTPPSGPPATGSPRPPLTSAAPGRRRAPRPAARSRPTSWPCRR